MLKRTIPIRTQTFLGICKGHPLGSRKTHTGVSTVTKFLGRQPWKLDLTFLGLSFLQLFSGGANSNTGHVLRREAPCRLRQSWELATRISAMPSGELVVSDNLNGF